MTLVNKYASDDQEFIDAYETEINIPVPLTPDMDEDEAELQIEAAMMIYRSLTEQHGKMYLS